MFPEKEPEPEKRAVLIKTPMVLQDSDFDKLASSKRGDTIVCTPVRIPRGTRGGVFVFIEGVSRKYLQRGGRDYRIVAIIRRKQTKRASPNARRPTVVALEGIAELPRDGKLTTKLLHWS